MEKLHLKIFLVLVFGIAITTTLTSLIISKVKQYQIALITEDMEFEARQTLNAMKNKLNGDINVIRLTERLFQANNGIDREGFNKFSLGIFELYPEIQAIQWLPIIQHTNRKHYELSVQKEGFKNFYISEVNSEKRMVRAQNRAFYTPVFFIEPMAGNEKYLGLDAESDPIARATLLQVKETGKIAITEPVQLEKETNPQPAVLIFLPSFKEDSKLGQKNNSKKNEIKGFVLLILRMGAFADKINQEFPLGKHTKYRLIDITEGRNIIASSSEQFSMTEGWRVVSLNWEIADRRWLYEVNFDVTQYLGYQTASLWSRIVFFSVVIILLLGIYLYYSKLKFKEQQNKDIKAFKNEEKRYKKLLNFSADAYFLQDLQGNLLDINEVACHVMGYTREELLELTVFDINEMIDGASKKNYLEYFKKLPRGKTIVRELSYIKKDGTLFPVEISLNKFAYNDTEVLSGFIRDISERKEYENSLKLAMETAEKANLAKSEFLANMSHEFRTPMHSILSFSDMGLKRIKSAPLKKLEDYFSNIQTSGQRLMKLLNGLLDLAKLETGMLKLSFEKCSIFLILDECVTEQELQLKEKNLELSMSNGGIGGDVICDVDKMRQVITNLLANAIKFTDESSTLSIQIDEDTKLLSVPGIKFSISDQGHGIPEDELEAIFDKFIQSSQQSSLHQGTGLGLAICSEIIEGHSGNIWAENIEGGACLNFVIPLTPPENLNRRSTDKNH